eukprot:gb/GEZN01022106.1/.p1 GENE.gb/GEZN01022106.1/~~gb/GEZN01022106.1/.p1  ORF type:complete len:145 (+),score=14.37 gb/GEZN01022106.1/:38-472(+)
MLARSTAARLLVPGRTTILISRGFGAHHHHGPTAEELAAAKAADAKIEELVPGLKFLNDHKDEVIRMYDHAPKVSPQDVWARISGKKSPDDFPVGHPLNNLGECWNEHQLIHARNCAVVVAIVGAYYFVIKSQQAEDKNPYSGI